MHLFPRVISASSVFNSAEVFSRGRLDRNILIDVQFCNFCTMIIWTTNFGFYNVIP